MREVAAVDATHLFGQLLHAVEHGEEIVITRDGREVARMVPVAERHNGAEARAALQRLRARAEARNLGPFSWNEWKRFRDEGRP